MGPATTKVLLERENELGRLQTSLNDAVEGRGGSVVIEGPAGIGKTALLRALLDLAEVSAIVGLPARGAEIERALPFGVIRRALEPALRALPEGDRAALLSGPARLAAPVVVPGSVGPDAPQQELSIFHGLYWLLADFCERHPLLLAIDDAHLADSASVGFLRYLQNRLQGLHLLLVTTIRTTDLHAESDRVRTLVEGASSVVRPRALTTSAVATLVRDRLGHDAVDLFCEACHDATGGNPFLVQELLFDLQLRLVRPDAAGANEITAMAPSSVSRSILSRIERLSREAMRLSEALALLGDSANARRSAALVDLSVDETAAAAEELEAAGILEPSDRFSFKHPLVRTAIYQNLSARRCSELHRRASRLLQAEGLPPEACAVHLLHVEPESDQDTVEILRAAARLSLSRGAAEAAATYLRRALAEPPVAPQRIDLLFELGHAELASGDVSAVEHLQSAYDGASQPQRATIAIDLGRALLMSGKVATAIEVFDREAEGVAAHDRESSLLLEAESLSATWVHGGASGVTPARLERALALPGASRGERAVLAAVIPPLAATGQRPARLIAELCRRALGDGELLLDQSPESPPFVLVAQELAYADELEAAAAHLDQGIAEARSRGSALGFFFCSGIRAMVSHRQGRLAEALSYGSQAVDTARRHGWVASFPTGAAILAEALIDHGDLDAADALLTEVERAQGPLTQRGAVMFHQVLYRRGLLNLVRGDNEGAIRIFLDLDRRKRAVADVNPARHSWLAMLARAFLANGEPEKARGYVDEALERAKAWGTRTAVAAAMRADALLCRGAARRKRLEEAVALLEASPARLEYARALFELGSDRVADADPQAVRAILRRALDIADESGAGLLAAGIRKKLIAAGGRPRRPRITGAESLTPSERRIAKLARDGLSNPEIAKALFVTRKTVETHLSNVYRKLEIGRREQLPEDID